MLSLSMMMVYLLGSRDLSSTVLSWLSFWFWRERDALSESTRVIVFGDFWYEATLMCVFLSAWFVMFVSRLFQVACVSRRSDEMISRVERIKDPKWPITRFGFGWVKTVMSSRILIMWNRAIFMHKMLHNKESPIHENDTSLSKSTSLISILWFLLPGLSSWFLSQKKSTKEDTIKRDC